MAKGKQQTGGKNTCKLYHTEQVFLICKQPNLIVGGEGKKDQKKKEQKNRQII